MAGEIDDKDLRKLARKLKGVGVLDRMRDVAVLARFVTDEDERKKLDSERRHLCELSKMQLDHEHDAMLDDMVERVRSLEDLITTGGDDAIREDVATPVMYAPGEGPH